MHIKVTRKSTEKALRLFYAQEPVTDNPGEGESLAEVEEAAYAILRNHVRAIDETEDDLLLIYLEAALDYMEQLTNRILGESDVIVYLDAEDLKRPFTLPKINDVTSFYKLEYRRKDLDDSISFLENYKMFEADYEDDINSEYITGLSQKHFALEEDGSNNIALFLNFNDISDLGTVNVAFQKRDSEGEYQTISNIGGLYTIADLSLSTQIMSRDAQPPRVPTEWPKGMYRVRAGVNATEEGGTDNYLYFTIHDGTDFDNVIITDRYPCYMDLREYKSAIGEDCSTHGEDFARAYITAGTDLMAVPKQYKQAALLLVGHYYNQREAENIGGITMEVKEGVHRLLQSVRHY